jgi:hypothetical protein
VQFVATLKVDPTGKEQVVHYEVTFSFLSLHMKSSVLMLLSARNRHFGLHQIAGQGDRAHHR